MAAEHWFRWHHGTVNDPKWRVVALRASHAMSRNVTIASVIAVWAAMLECASQANPRGELVGWDDEDVAAGLGLAKDEVAAIREAMEGKTLRDGALSAWDIRQPKREDSSSAERKRAQRERQRAAGNGVTSSDNESSHTKSHKVTLETETETEEKEQTPPIPPAVAGGTRKRTKGEGITFAAFVQACRESGEKPLPADHSVFDFAADTGIPRDYLQLAWREFVRQYRDTRKTQAGVKGWRQKFENCVRRNWYKLWWFPSEGACDLTTAGVQLQRELESEHQRREAEPGPSERAA